MTSKYMLNASSVLVDQPHHFHYALMKWDNCWSPKANDLVPFLQVFLKHVVYVTAVGTKGGLVEGQKHWVRSYQLRYSFAGQKWRLYFENLIEKVYKT